MPSWSDPAWLSDAAAWIDEQLARLGVTPTGAVEQTHVRPWSTVLRVPVTGTNLWFKANMPSLAYEAAAVRILSRRAPDRVPQLLAVDPERRWMLMADAGESLREVVARERSLARWLDILPLYARVQVATTGDVDALSAAGVPHRRLEDLDSEYALLLEAVRGLTRDESSRLRALRRDVREMCRKLAALGIPETIQHDDLHDGQVFVRDSGYVVADWGDCCVSHPFFTMAVTLEGNLAWGLDDVAGSVDVRPFADSYLGSFAAYGTAAELRAALAVALRLGWICRALNVQRWAASLDPPDRDEHLDGVAIRLRLFLGGLS